MSATPTAVDARFLEELFRSYGQRIYRRARVIMGDADASEDVMQEVFLRAFGARAEFATADSPLSWLYRITTNICLNRLRDARRHRDILGRVTRPGEPANSVEPDAGLTVRTLLVRVPPHLREIAIHYFVDEMSQDEISSLLDVPRRTVGYRLEQFRDIAQQAARKRAAAA